MWLPVSSLDHVLDEMLQYSPCETELTVEVDDDGTMSWRQITISVTITITIANSFTGRISQVEEVDVPAEVLNGTSSNSMSLRRKAATAQDRIRGDAAGKTMKTAIDCTDNKDGDGDDDGDGICEAVIGPATDEHGSAYD